MQIKFYMRCHWLNTGTNLSSHEVSLATDANLNIHVVLLA